MEPKGNYIPVLGQKQAEKPSKYRTVYGKKSDSTKNLKYGEYNGNLSKNMRYSENNSKTKGRQGESLNFRENTNQNLMEEPKISGMEYSNTSELATSPGLASSIDKSLNYAPTTSNAQFSAETNSNSGYSYLTERWWETIQTPKDREFAKNLVDEILESSGSFNNCQEMLEEPKNFINCPETLEEPRSFNNSAGIMLEEPRSFNNSAGIMLEEPRSFNNSAGIMLEEPRSFINCQDIIEASRSFNNGQEMLEEPKNFINCPEMLEASRSFNNSAGIMLEEPRSFINCQDIIEASKSFNNCQDLINQPYLMTNYHHQQQISSISNFQDESEAVKVQIRLLEIEKHLDNLKNPKKEIDEEMEIIKKENELKERAKELEKMEREFKRKTGKSLSDESSNRYYEKSKSSISNSSSSSSSRSKTIRESSSSNRSSSGSSRSRSNTNNLHNKNSENVRRTHHSPPHYSTTSKRDIEIRISSSPSSSSLSPSLSSSSSKNNRSNSRKRDEDVKRQSLTRHLKRDLSSRSKHEKPKAETISDNEDEKSFLRKRRSDSKYLDRSDDEDRSRRSATANKMRRRS